MTCPTRPNPAGTQFFQNFTGGGYFFLDGKDRIWSATKTSHLMVLAIRDNGRKLVKVADYDLSKVLTDNQRISSALPDWQGRIWFVSKKDGVIGVLDTKTGKIETITLNEEIENSFAVDRDGVYIASDKRMYRFNAGKDNKPVVDWKVTYKNSGIHKPSQLNAGTGTTPTIFNHGDFVTITDNADPMNVVVYRTAKKLPQGHEAHGLRDARSSARAPARPRTRSSPPATRCSSRTTTATRTRSARTPTPRRPRASRAIDVDPEGNGCKVRWTNKTAPVPTLVSKLSTKTGLIYTYIAPKHAAGTPQPWYWAAIDARTGKEAWRKLAGTGLGFNNNYSGVSIGKDGTAYIGTFGAIQSLRDGSAR